MTRADGAWLRLGRRRARWSRVGVSALLVMFALGLLTLLRPAEAAAAPSSCPFGGGPAFRLQAFEADRMRSLYLQTQILAAANQLFPGDDEFALPVLKVGEARVETLAAMIPPQLLHAIAWIESDINQVHINDPYGELGRALISPDCGYGIMQITSTIDNDGGLPSRYEALVGTHFAYNIAAGARILAEKWNEDYFPVVGERDPRFIESWYFALWAYNGWVWINHPGNRMFDPARGTYDCDTDKSDYFDYPYQERVLGCVINPPIVDGQRLWEPHPVDLPNIPTVTAPGGPLDPDLFWQSLDQVRQRMSMALPSGAVQAALGFGALQDRTALLGMPEADDLVDELELSSSELTARGAELLIANRGSGLLAWRVLETPSWLEVGFQAGVALGSGYRFTRGPDESRIPIAAAAGGVPEGSHRGRIELEFYYPDGTSERESVAISLDKQGAAFYEAGRPQS
ncbi:MAG: transglycosylase SLT domain-containing protein [Chloroflexi bacterium]|nr:transglycosylase SLT domain-containing protein [Chloroflexota bacterium]